MSASNVRWLTVGVLAIALGACRSAALEPARASESVEDQAIRFDESGRELRRITGRVAFPPGTPADEDVTVVVQARYPYHGQAHETELRPDRSFRFDLPPDASHVYFGLDAKYLFLPFLDLVEADLPLTEAVVLRPELGGRFLFELEGSSGRSPAEDPHWQGATLAVDCRLPNMGSLHQFELQAGIPFELDALSAAGSYHVHLFGPSFIDLARKGLRVRPGESTTVVFELRPGATFEGRVADHDGKGIPGVEVLAMKRPPGKGWRSVAIATTDSDGLYSISGIPSGELRLTFLHGDYDSRSLDPRHGTTDCTLEPRGTAILRGRVLDPQGLALPDCEVRVTYLDFENDDFFPPGDRTGPEGSFELEGLRPGRVRLWAYYRKYGRSSGLELELVGGEILERLEITFESHDS